MPKLSSVLERTISEQAAEIRALSTRLAEAERERDKANSDREDALKDEADLRALWEGSIQWSQNGKSLEELSDVIDNAGDCLDRWYGSRDARDLAELPRALDMIHAVELSRALGELHAAPRELSFGAPPLKSAAMIVRKSA